MQPARFNAYMLQQVPEKDEFASGIVITFQVMAVAGVSPGNPHAIRTVSECGKDELGANPPGAGYSDDPDVGRVLKAAHTGKIGCPITAPVTQKGSNSWFPFTHSSLLFDKRRNRAS
jgi:hypothetical protein